jgi:predicted pyridoxine 5'-phosphate oxidase superfamily flavin-nucleotide-binding protein
VCLFLMDYPKRARLKIYAHVETVDLGDDPQLAETVAVGGYKAKLERAFRMRLEAFDWNCPQHITPRFTEREIMEAVRPLQNRVAELETENAALRARLNPTGDV